MILSDKWLMENNQAAVRFDLRVCEKKQPQGSDFWQEYKDLNTLGLKMIVGRYFTTPGEKVLAQVIAQTAYEACAKHGNYDQEFTNVDFEIRLSKDSGHPIIFPFEEKSIKEAMVDGHMSRVPSFGLSSYGYDVSLQPVFDVFTNVHTSIIDPLNFDNERNCVRKEGESCILPPNSYLLGYTREVFSIPRDVLAICVGKSTYARCGAIVNTTPIEPGFEGSVVIEIANATPSPMIIHANGGIAQFFFLQGDRPCAVSYKDRAGKYQNQRGIVHAKV